MRWIDEVKLQGKLRRHRSTVLGQAIAAVEQKTESAEIFELRNRVAPVLKKDPASAAKYSEPNYWILLNALRAADLDLHSNPGLKILDIGCGPGYFLAMARALAHEIEGVEAPAEFLTPIEREIYPALTCTLGVAGAIQPLLIQRFTPLPFSAERFDLITAYWICFNRHRQPDEWSVEEWRFFTEDALRCIRPGGRIFLELNANPERYGTLRFYDEATRDYFRSLGEVDGGRVLVTASK
jgi:SAM-dependent methyltransferase